ncbi:MAG: tetratricopeptide repeat protein [Sediminibacterium sp.]|nr:tetratricopeptide repeat protein [Sediminibacterium sp.]
MNNESKPSFFSELLQEFNIPIEKVKKISYVILIIAVIIGGYYYYKIKIAAPKELEAEQALFPAESLFRIDSFNLALNGNAAVKGFLQIAKKYDGTKAANLCHYYAGVCYLQMGNFNSAVKQLEDFDSKDPNINMMAAGCLADAYSELKKYDQAIKYYQKAAESAPDQDNVAGEYMFRAGFLSELNGKNDQAIEYYNRVKKEFPRSEKGAQIDKYIARLSTQPN